VLEFAQKNYGVTFAMHAKIDVNGNDAHPLYQWLRREAKGILGTTAIKWNFTKFIVDKHGKVLDRLAPNTTPSSLVPTLEPLLV
jgi:glutathione peroxidase